MKKLLSSLAWALGSHIALTLDFIVHELASIIAFCLWVMTRGYAPWPLLLSMSRGFVLGALRVAVMSLIGGVFWKAAIAGFFVLYA